MSAQGPDPDSTGTSRDPLERLAESFLARFRAGEHPGLEEYARRCPELADDIRELFPALVEMEGLKASLVSPSHPGAERGDAPVRLGDYIILREIGRGGMGVVYEAVQESLNRRVALKVLPRETLARPRALARFRREARSAAALHHTNIVPVFGVGEADGHHYYAMQYIPGHTLEAVLDEVRRLKRDRDPREAVANASARRTAIEAANAATAGLSRLTMGLMNGQIASSSPAATEAVAVASRAAEPRDEVEPGEASATTSSPSSSSSLALAGGTVSEYHRGVARIGLQVAEALEYAHGQGVLHRDIKPSNLLLDLGGAVWVADFGLAKPAEDDDLSTSREVVGTIRYMAPERFDGWSDRRSDVYGLGVTMYEMLALRPAFNAGDHAGLIRQVLHATPTSPRFLDRKVPRDLETIVLKAMSREASERYVSAGAMADDLRRFLSDRTITARRSGWPERAWRWCRRNPIVASLSLATMALALITSVISTIAYLRTSSALAREVVALRETVAERQKVVIERDNASRSLYRSLLGEARATRLARELGYRERVNELLRQAMAVEVADRDLEPLRQEASACLGDVLGLRPLVLGPFAKPISTGPRYRPKGDLLAVGLQDGRVLLLDARDGRELHALACGTSAVKSIWFHGDDRLKVLGDDGHLETCVLGPNGWMATDVRELGHGIHSVATTPEGKDRFIRLTDRGLEIGDATTGEIVRRFEDDHLSAEFAPVPSPDGRLVATLGTFGQRPESNDGVTILDVSTGERVAELHTGLGPAYCLEFRPDGRILAAGSTEGVRLFEFGKDGAPVPTAALRSSAVTRITFGHEGRTLLAASRAGVMLWYVPSTQGMALLEHPENSNVHSMSLSADGTRLATASPNRLAVWRLGATGERRALAGHSGGTTSTAFSPDDRRIASSSKDGTAKIWDRATGRLLHVIEGFAGPVQMLDFSPDGRLIATGDTNGELRFLDAASLEPLAIVRNHGLRGAIMSVRFSRDGRLLAASGESGVGFWSITRETGEARPTRLTFRRESLIDAPWPTDVAIDPEGTRVGFIHNHTTIRLWDLARRSEIPFGGPGVFLGFSALEMGPRGWLGYVGSSGQVEIWDTHAAPPRRVRQFGEPGSHKASQYTVTDDGRRALTLGSNSPVIWDVETGVRLATLRREMVPAWDGMWSHDGRTICLALSDGGIVLWDLDIVRAQLAALGLDWNDPAPNGPSATPPRPTPPSGPIEVRFVADAPAPEPFSPPQR